jgi:hypothetical protein
MKRRQPAAETGCLEDVDKRTHSADHWDAIATDVPDPPKCVEDCQLRFLQNVVPDFEQDFTKVCQVLSSLAENRQAGGNQNLWPLYCCDSAVCGVWFNQTGRILAQDRKSIPNY